MATKKTEPSSALRTNDSEQKRFTELREETIKMLVTRENTLAKIRTVRTYLSKADLRSAKKSK